MQHSALCKCRQRLMHTLDHDIRPAVRRRARTGRMQPEMCPVRLIHDERQSVTVYNPRDRRNIGHNTVIRRTRNIHRPNQRVCLQRPSDHIRRNRALYIKIADRRITVMRLQPPQIHGMIRRFMRIARQQYPSAPRRSGRNRRQNAARTAVHEEKAAFHTNIISQPLLFLPQNPLCMMQIVESIDFRNIQMVGIHRQLHMPLMPRHMKRVQIRLVVGLQLLQ